MRISPRQERLVSKAKSGLEVSFDKPVYFTKLSGNMIQKITVLEVLDLPGMKTVLAKTDKMVSYALWEGEDYDKIGNWTDDDVKARLKEIIESGKF